MCVVGSLVFLKCEAAGNDGRSGEGDVRATLCVVVQLVVMWCSAFLNYLQVI